LLGGSAEVASEAAQQIVTTYPTIGSVKHYSPPFHALQDMDNVEIIKRVRSAKPDIVLVCFGCPKQEKWIAQNIGELAVPVMIGAGATIDFLAEKMARAPVWMQRSGTEWLFRLLQEPRRLSKRYADDFLHFFPAVLRQRWHQRPPGPKRSWKGRQ
jgi:exopolysaccharide biosynthesis WecB/TagA/CpsF family protein